MQTTIQQRYLAAKRALFDKAYGSLNDRQREAVFTVNHPLLVLAGAGSGKTTVLVRRIGFIIRYGNAYLSDRVPDALTEETVARLESALSLPAEELESSVLPEFAESPCEPYRMLAITFTNKAANEIKTRISASFPEDSFSASEIVTGTFHSVCVRILTRHGERLGYKPNFTIYDADDTKRAVRAAMERCGIDEKLLPVKTVINAVSRAKDRLLTPDDFAAEAGQDFRQKQIARIYEAYQQYLRESNAMDFDDLIMQTVLLLKNFPDVRDAYQRRFRYVCVDEFQDTNVAQLQLTVLLSGGSRNLMVVGDDDQSIYKFRGATIENILSFDRTFPEATVIKLEQNYRSTQTILDAANAVIANNSGRKGKTLWTAQNGGAPICLRLCTDQNTEARSIVDTVIRSVAAKEATYRDFAVLCRTNAQSQSIERVFARSAVPYRFLGGTRFTDRKEIKDAVAYLQLINNHDDNLRLARIINEPKRNVGEKTLAAIEQIAAEQGCSQFTVIEHASDYVALERSRAKLEQFAALIRDLTEKLDRMPLDAFFDAVLDQSGYRQMLISAGAEAADRLENLEEFKSGILEYVKECEQNEDGEAPTLSGFLEETALVADVDRYDETADAVVMMTIHSAKGLEFPIVFLPGMEDGLFPGMQTITEGEAEMEEERRLAYVAITRAKKKLYLLHTRSRILYGQTMYNPVSRFVSEIPEKLLKKEKESGGAEERFVRPHTPGYGAVPSQPSPARPKTYFTESAARTIPPQKRTAGDTTTVGKSVFAASTAKKELFRPGDRVVHPAFGTGEILSAKPMGADTLYEIIFDRVGTKKLMATYAKLTKV